MEVSLSPGRLMAAFNAGIADEAWSDLPMPMLSNPRVRFWFTERGWPARPTPCLLLVAAGLSTGLGTGRRTSRRSPRSLRCLAEPSRRRTSWQCPEPGQEAGGGR